MKSILTVLFALSLASFLTLHADDSAKSGTKTAEPQFVYFKGSFTKYHHGKREEALDLIHSRFWAVDQVVGRKPIPFDFLTGQWDHMVFFRLHGGLADVELEKDAMQAKWDQQLEKQEGGPEKAKALHDYHESLVMKRGGGLFKVPAADVDFSDQYYNKGGKPTYYRVNFSKYKSGKKEQAIDFIMDNFRPVRLAIGGSVIPMFSVAGGWDHIVFFPMPGGLGDFESDSLSDAWEEEFAKRQGGRDKAAEATKFYTGLVKESITGIAKARWKK
jgi:hypothetical protein